MHKKPLFTVILTVLLLMISSMSKAQGISPEGAFVRSLVIPGWGHYYVDHDQWTRGQIHLGTEITLIVSYFGFAVRANNLETQYETLASLKAGINISGRSRTFQIALADFNTMQEYNDFQLRSRNWNRVFENQPENQWNWETEKDRDHYSDLRSDLDRVRNQLPAILGLMVVNRVVSALSAYNRARSQSSIPEISLLPVSGTQGQMGVIGKMNIRF